MEDDKELLGRIKKLSREISKVIESIVLTEELPRGADLDILLCSLMTTIKHKKGEGIFKDSQLEEAIIQSFNQYASQVGINVYAQNYVDPSTNLPH